MAFSDNVLNGIPLTRENFTDPPLEMGIVPFWFWNGRLEEDELEWQLRQYHDRGVRSLFIHGRMGLRVPYLSEDWFERVKFVVEKAKEIGIDAWVYDEMDWPSGTAGKQVMQADPDLSQRYLELVALYFKGPLFTFLEAHDDRYVNTGRSNPVAAFGVRQHEYEGVISELVDLNKNLAWERTIPWEAPAGDWVLMYFLEKTDPHYIDTLNPASTEKFLELTHERYRKAVGHEFGDTVPGFFTDEPAMYYYHVGLKNHVIPWSKHMFRIFRERRGYDLKPHLPALYREVGDETARIRYDFWRTLTEQYAQTYYKRIRDWCEEHGVIFTGHLLFEEHLRLVARCEGNIFRYLEQMHLIGVDHLYPKIGRREDPAQHVALKVASSAAHHFGSTRLLCESMGGTYWNCTLERMKWMNNWEYVLGVNLFNNHGYHYSIEGERKRDWPPSQFYHHTWWKYYDRFTAYNARLSHLLSGGRHVAKVLMLYPINSIWVNYMPQELSRVSELIESDFQYLTDTLLRLHHDFDYVDEDVLAKAEVKDGIIHIGEETYEVFIMPPVTHIKESTYEVLEHFLESGGCLIADALVPVALLESSEAEGGVAPLDSFFGIRGRAVLDAFKEHEEEPFDLVRLHQGGDFYFFKGDGLYSKKLKVQEMGEASRQAVSFILTETGLKRARTVEEFLTEQGEIYERKEQTLRRVLRECVSPDVAISDEEVFYLHREKDGFDVYFFVNALQEDRGRVVIYLERVGRPELWNPNTGEVRPLHTYRIAHGRLVFELDFPASESHVVVVIPEEARVPHVISTNLDVVELDEEQVVGYASSVRDEVFAEVRNGGDAYRVAAAALKPLPAIELPGEYDFQIEPDNVLSIDDWRMYEAGTDGRQGDFASPDLDDGAWLQVTRGAWEMQLPQERDEQTYPVTLWYRTSFDVAHMPDAARLMIDGFSGRRYDLFVNGQHVTDPGRRSYLDAEIREVDVRPFLLEGRNVVAVRLEVVRRTDGMLDLLKITGPFAIDAEGRIAAPESRLPVGDWAHLGYPYFSGTGTYSCSVNVPEEYLDGGRIYLEADCGEDVLEVSVNGSDGRVAPWHPYRIEVGDLLRAGANQLTLNVTNTLANILDGVQEPSGLFAPPRLVHERRYELALSDAISPYASLEAAGGESSS